MSSPPSLAAALLAGDRRAASRLISMAEAGDPAIESDLRVLYRKGRKAPIIGMTGPPGAGKSTLIAGMIESIRRDNRRVAVLAVDPSSPLSGGAVLGDRVRMSRRAEDTGVFIRSMAARGALGGLSHAAGDALTILDCMDFDCIILETVGVGQSEMDILGHADVVILLQTALGGDVVQLVKAGILEIADIIVVNKADAPGSDRMIGALKEMAAHRIATAEGWITPVIATEATAGKGVDLVLTSVNAFLACRSLHPEDARRRDRARILARAMTIAKAGLQRRINKPTEARVLEMLDSVIRRDMDPHEAAEFLLRSAGG